MVEVGEIAIAVGPPEHGVEQRRGGAHVLVERRRRRRRRSRSPSVASWRCSRASGESPSGARAAWLLDQVARRNVEEPRKSGRPSHRRVGRRGQSGEQQSPLQGGVGLQHRAGPGAHGRDAPLAQHVGHLGGAPLGRDEDADIRRLDAPRRVPCR